MKTRMTRQDLMEWAADNYSIVPNSEGSPNEALMAGWINAMDVEEDSSGELTDEDFLDYAYSEFENMGYHQS